ncbi:MAG: sulfurtransferase TusA family protein [Magnetococcales bacterium]|nr:sulfurtransferase TusA family protein [Magnetococcales bacterium]
MSERKTIDARGSFCPGPLMELIAGIKLAEVGEELEILSGDRGSAEDIPAWIAKVGHEYIKTDKIDDYWSIIVKKTK